VKRGKILGMTTTRFYTIEGRLVYFKTRTTTIPKGYFDIENSAALFYFEESENNRDDPSIRVESFAPITKFWLYSPSRSDTLILF
jgi:hypothetical protein